MKFNKELFNKWLNDKYAIQVETHEQYNQLMKLIEEATDLTWLSGKTPTRYDCFNTYHNLTCVQKNEHRLVCGNLHSCKSRDYKIIKFKDLAQVEIPKIIGAKYRVLANDHFRFNKGEIVTLMSVDCEGFGKFKNDRRNVATPMFDYSKDGTQRIELIESSIKQSKSNSDTKGENKNMKKKMSRQEYAQLVAKRRVENDFIAKAIAMYKAEHNIMSDRKFIVNVNGQEIAVFFNKKQRPTLFLANGNKANASDTLAVLNGEYKFIKLVGE